MTGFRKPANGVAALAIAGVFSAATYRVLQNYRRGIERAYATIADADTEFVETSAGTVEYQTRGQGTPILVSHGIVGGFDQAMQTGESLIDSDAQLIGVSRFGYLGSERPTDATPERQADAYRDLLDELDIDDVILIGTSAGGAPAIKFALEYPQRTRRLVLIGSTAPTDRELSGPTGPPHAILRDSVFWGLITYAPWVFHRLFGIERTDVAAATPAEQKRLAALLATLVPVEPRIPGIITDERVTNTAMATRSDDYPVEQVQSPTLIIHARDDPLASFADAAAMADRIPDVDFRPYDSGGHLVFGHGDEIRQAVTALAQTAR